MLRRALLFVTALLTSAPVFAQRTWQPTLAPGLRLRTHHGIEPAIRSNGLAGGPSRSGRRGTSMPTR